MFTLSNSVWTAKKCIKSMERFQITLDNAIQRGEVWDNKKKSLFIHSAIVGYPTQKMFAAKTDGIYDILDGKQRLSALRDYINGEFALTGLSRVESKVWTMTDKGEKEITILRKKFHELPESVQDTFCDYNIDICAIENATDEEVSEMFKRLNNGKSLSPFDVMRGTIPMNTLATIKLLSDHDIFEKILTAKEQDKLDADELIVKTWIALYDEPVNFTASHVRTITSSLEITDEQEQEIDSIYTKFLEAYKVVSEEVKEKISRRTNFLSLMSVFKDTDIAILVAVMENFFTTGTSVASINEEYNACVLQGSTNQQKTLKRIEILKSEIEKVK